MEKPKLTVILISLLFVFILSMHIHLVKERGTKNNREYTLKKFYKVAESRKKISLTTQKNTEKQAKKKEKINISEACIDDIISIKGFGRKLAEKIINEVKVHNGNLTEEDILAIPGIGKARLNALKERFIIPVSNHHKSNNFVSDSVCPYCKKNLNAHTRKKKDIYIYCPHCLKYLPVNKN